MEARQETGATDLAAIDPVLMLYVPVCVTGCLFVPHTSSVAPISVFTLILIAYTLPS